MAEVKAPYRTSSDAYRAIHEGLAAEVECSLSDCEYASAMKAAKLMREIEEHTDIEGGAK